MPITQGQPRLIGDVITHTIMEDVMESAVSRCWCADSDIRGMFRVLKGEDSKVRFNPPFDGIHGRDPDIIAQFTVERFRAAIIQLAVENWLEGYDAESADAAIQLACFGEVVYDRW